MVLLFKYIIFALIEVFILQLATIIKNKTNDNELSRKCTHIGCLSTTFIIPYLLFKKTPHFFISISIFVIIDIIMTFVDGLLPQIERENSEDDNKKSSILEGLAMIPLSILAYMNPEWMLPCGIGFITLAFGDGFAALVGVKYGKYSIKIKNKKSLIGSLGFIIFALIGMIGIHLLLREPIYIGTLLLISLISSIIELYSGDYDNFLIPMISAILTYLLL